MRSIRLGDTAALALVLAVPLAAALFYGGPGGQAFAAAPGFDGKAVFLAQKCNLCHSVGVAAIVATTKSERMKGPDLGGKVAERGGEWTVKFLKKQVMLADKPHAKAFTGSDAELEALVAWLAQQKE